MKQIKYFLIALIGMLLISSASSGQSPKLWIKYTIEVYDSPANELTMNMQVWIPGNSSTITTAFQTPQIIPPHTAGSSDYIEATSFGSNYDIYSVRIYDNSGGGNDANIGGGGSTTDDFDYKPYTVILNYDATFYSIGIHAAGVDLH